MQIRNYEQKDQRECLAIFETCLPLYFSNDERELFLEYLKRLPAVNHYYVGTIDDKIVACGGFSFKGAQASFDWGMVDSAFHRKGFGKEISLFRIDLIKAIFNKSNPDNKYSIRLSTSQHTFAFYERLGFEVCEIEKAGLSPELDKYEMLYRHN